MLVHSPSTGLKIYFSIYAEHLLSDAWLADVEWDRVPLLVTRTDSRVSLLRELPQIFGHLLAPTEWQLEALLVEQLRKISDETEWIREV